MENGKWKIEGGLRSRTATLLSLRDISPIRQCRQGEPIWFIAQRRLRISEHAFYFMLCFLLLINIRYFVGADLLCLPSAPRFPFISIFDRKALHPIRADVRFYRMTFTLIGQHLPCKSSVTAQSAVTPPLTKEAFAAVKSSAHCRKIGHEGNVGSGSIKIDPYNSKS